MSDSVKKVVVTTKHRGVFFGTLVSRDKTDVVLSDARLCVYWSSLTKGFVGLASTGPLKGSKVSPAAPKLELLDVTSVVECSDEAVEKWESEPWG